MEETMAYLGFRDGRRTFALLCPTCHAEGEIGVKPNVTRLIQCPNKCGAMFMQRNPKGLFAKPYLEFVIGKAVPMNSAERAEQFEVLYTAYIAKLRRIDDLKVQGRYGYQLRMPKRALAIAMENLRAFGKEHNVEVESLFY